MPMAGDPANATEVTAMSAISFEKKMYFKNTAPSV
jgi:hypothetical protein